MHTMLRKSSGEWSAPIFQQLALIRAFRELVENSHLEVSFEWAVCELGQLVVAKTSKFFILLPICCWFLCLKFFILKKFGLKICNICLNLKPNLKYSLGV